MPIALAILHRLLRCTLIVSKFIYRVLLSLTVVFVIVVLVGNIVFATKRDEPHRNLHPHSPHCVDKNGWSILSETENSELTATEKDPAWETKLQCAIQTHIVPTKGNSPALSGDLRYHLGFLEFREDGSPQMLRGGPKETRSLVQYTALQDHLKDPARNSNFIIVFIHGWRHDARIGDSNVSDLRHYAAHVARFLASRCRDEARFCGTEVTAIYVGWRGARVDETKLKNWFGQTIGGFFAGAAMWVTLFDRKPISEEVGPGAVTALRGLERIVERKKAIPPAGSGKSNEQRMIVFGHSLGGNMLITALKDQLIKDVARHTPNTLLDAPLGDLTVLINPASEAANWTAIQRAIWQRIAFKDSDNISEDTTKGVVENTTNTGHLHFPRHQSPVLMSVTAARSWPPSGIWPHDCVWLNLPSTDPVEIKAKGKMLSLIAGNRWIYASGIKYDWATYELFPTFKLDFRPLAETVQRYADYLADKENFGTGRCPTSVSHTNDGVVSYFWTLLSRPVALVASILRNIPFMNTDREQTRTIGHFDPTRPSTDTMLERVTLPIKPFGTTHELIGDRDGEKPIDYSLIPSAQEAVCPSSSNWLWRARNARPPNGTYWDSNQLEPLVDGRNPKPAAHFVHSFINAGMAGITRANDPFWNVRAFDNALSLHGGYLLSSFICAMNQFVMDNVAHEPRP